MRLSCPLRRSVFAVVFAIALFAQIASQAQSSTPPRSGSTTNSSTAKNAKPNTTAIKCTDNGTYVNSKGQTVKRPETCSGPPKGATAHCRDGSYSFSQSRRGTCSHRGGVAKWL
jgi:resuscitation-promoting factor RpfB